MLWQDEWELVEANIGGGGQGHTHRVSRKTDKQQGVLKTLKNNEDPKARSRMFRESAALQSLAETASRIPVVFASNTEEYADLAVPLYIVMDYIPGPTLEEYIKSNGPLPLEEAFRITREVALTLKNGHSEAILHRDLKPKNIIMSGIGNPDGKGPLPFIVDYGLSFNRETDTDLTGTDEAIWNEFIYLPETNIDGEDHRDMRSDVTSLAGILYYCLTGHAPHALMNSEGQLPHRRGGKELSALTANTTTLAYLNALFDRAFRSRLDGRFSDCTELLGELDKVEKVSQLATGHNVAELAAHASETLRAGNRSIQIAHLQSRGEAPVHTFFNALQQLAGTYDLFEVAVSIQQPSSSLPKGYDQIAMTLCCELRCPRLGITSLKLYEVAARELSLVLLNKEVNFDQPTVSDMINEIAMQAELRKTGIAEIPPPTWSEIVSFDPEQSCEATVIMDDARRWLADQIHKITLHALPK